MRATGPNFGSAESISRRRALARAAALLGGAISAPTMAGVLAGCGRGPGAEGAWRPRTLSAEQDAMVLSMGEHILPETDTPGARAARVNEFIDAMLTDYYPADVREGFLAGLGRAEARARRAFGAGYNELSPERQYQVVEVLNRWSYEEAPEPRGPLGEESPITEGEETPGDVRELEADRAPEDLGSDSFFRQLKELVLVGYYTSEVGATQELSVNPMGTWRADIPYEEVGHSWA